MKVTRLFNFNRLLIIRTVSNNNNYCLYTTNKPFYSCNNNIISNSNNLLTIKHNNNNVLSINAWRFTTSSAASPPDEKPEQKPSRTQLLKKAVAEYGSTVIVFHITISLMSLGFFYMLVSSGLDISSIIERLGVKLSDDIGGKIASNAGTFAVAYAVHKVFAPVRIAITLTATPFIVRRLRAVGFIKAKK